MKIRYYNFRLIGGRVYFLANGFRCEARYGVLRSDLLRKSLAA